MGDVKEPDPAQPARKRWAKHLRWTLASFVVLFLGGYLAVEPILESIVRKQLDSAGCEYGDLFLTRPGFGGIGAAGVTSLRFPEESGFGYSRVDKLTFNLGYDLFELVGSRKVKTFHIQELEVSLDLAAWRPPPKSNEPPPDIRNLPRIFLEALPKGWPLGRLSSDKLVVNLKKGDELLQSIPFQLAFDDSGAIKVTAPFFEFRSNLHPAQGEADVKLRYQLDKLPGFLESLFPFIKDAGTIEALVVDGSLVVTGKEFGSTTLSAALESVTTPQGEFQSPSLSLELGKGLQPEKAMFRTKFADLRAEDMEVSSGELVLDFGREKEVYLKLHCGVGIIHGYPYQSLNLAVTEQQGKLDAVGAIEQSGETIPFKATLEDPIILAWDNWLRSPGSEIPGVSEAKALLDRLDVLVGPVELEGSEVLNPLSTGLPGSLVSGVFKARKAPGEPGGTLSVDNAGIHFTESNLSISGIKAEVDLAVEGLPSTKGDAFPVMEIGEIKFGNLVLANGKVPFRLLATGDGEAARNVLVTRDIRFDSLGGKLGLAGSTVQLDGYDMVAFAKMLMEDIKLEEVLKLVDDFPVRLSGSFKGGSVTFQYSQQKLSLVGGSLGLNSLDAEDGDASRGEVVLGYDAKGAFTKGLEKGTPQFVNMKRIEEALAKLVFTGLTLELNPPGTPGLVFLADIQAKHEGKDWSVSLNAKASLFGNVAQGGAALDVEGTLQLNGDSIPFKIHTAHPYFGDLAAWFQSPAEKLPQAPESVDIAEVASVRLGPVALKESKLVNWLVPGLPKVKVTGDFTASRGAGEEILIVEANIKKLSIPEQEVTVSGIRTKADIGWDPAPHTEQPALLEIAKIEVKNWELENAKLPWQLFKEGILQTPGGDVSTLGGFIVLGATSVVLNGPETVTTGLFRLQEIDFEKVMSLTDTPPLFLQASFDGSVPFILKGDNLQLMPGALHLKNGTKALLKYDAKGQLTNGQEKGTLGWKNMDLAEKALQELHIEDLTLNLYPENDRDLPLQAMVKGSHDNGKRKVNLDLTLNLRGNVKAILQQAAKGKLEISP
jgi:hypothetical protein